MTTLTYDQGADVRGLSFLTAFQFGSYSNVSHTGFDVTDGVVGALTDHVTGSDIYWGRGDVPYEGQISAISGTYNGADYFDMSGLDLSLKTLMHDLETHNHGKLEKLFFGGDDQITGSLDKDTLYGFAGNDVLSGRSGDDHIIGGAGQDSLFGGGGKDHFVFLDASDSTTKAPDVIGDLSDQDFIDLSRVDPNLHVVDHFDGQADEMVLKYDPHTEVTSLKADIDGDGKADMAIMLDGDHHDFTNFIL